MEETRVISPENQLAYGISEHRRPCLSDATGTSTPPIRMESLHSVESALACPRDLVCDVDMFGFRWVQSFIRPLDLRTRVSIEETVAMQRHDWALMRGKFNI